MGYSGAGGKLIHKKNQKQKISRPLLILKVFFFSCEGVYSEQPYFSLWTGRIILPGVGNTSKKKKVSRPSPDNGCARQSEQVPGMIFAYICTTGRIFCNKKRNKEPLKPEAKTSIIACKKVWLWAHSALLTGVKTCVSERGGGGGQGKKVVQCSEVLDCRYSRIWWHTLLLTQHEINE